VPTIDQFLSDNTPQTEAFQRAKSRGYVLDPNASYSTALSPTDEQRFLADVQAGKLGKYVDTSPSSDYDMRGFWKAQQGNDPIASQSMNQNDGQMHFPDKWKTPYHQSFSNESQYASPTAPRWVNDSQLADPKSGEVIFDEKAATQGRRSALQHGTTIAQFLDSPEPPELRAAPGPIGAYPEPDVPQPSLAEQYGPTALRMGGPVTGALIGSAVLPVGGTIVGGFLGGAGGEMGARRVAGQPQALLPTLAAGAGGAFFPGAGGGLETALAKGALANAGLNAASSLAQGESPSGTGMLIGGLVGAAGGVAMHGIPGRPAEVPTPPRLEANPLPPPLAEPLPRFNEAQLPATPQGPPASQIPIRTGPGAEPTPLIGDVPRGSLLGPDGRPLNAPTELILPNHDPNSSARITQASGEPFPADSEGPLREMLQRRGIPEEEINRIVAETAPQQAPTPDVALAQPSEITGRPMTAGGELLAREGTAPLRAGVERALAGEVPPPPPEAPMLLPDHSSPLQDSLQHGADQASIAPPPPEPLPQGPRTLSDMLRQDQGFHLGEPIGGRPEQSVSPGDLLQAARDARASLAEANRVLDLSQRAERGSGEVSPAEVARAVNTQQEKTALLASLETTLKSQRGASTNPLLAGVARAGVGGLVGATQGDTPAEKIRNAALGAGAFALASPALIGRILSGKKPELPGANPIADVVAELGNKARAVEGRVAEGDFTAAHELADTAEKNIQQLVARAGEITGKNRLFRVVADTFLEKGPLHETNTSTATGAGQVLQRYSQLAQMLRQEAAKGDPEAEKLLNTLYGTDKGGVVNSVINFWRASLVGRVSTGVRNAFDQGSVVVTGALDRVMTGAVEGLRTGKPIAGTAQGLLEAYRMGEVSARRAWQGTAEMLHLIQKEPDAIDKIIPLLSGKQQQLLSAPEGLGGKLGTYLKVANAVNNVQEEYFGKVWIEAELRNRLARAGIDPEQALRNPQSIPPQILAGAADAALSGIFRNMPKGRVGQELLKFFSAVPEAHLILPFPRYILNRMQYITDHNPLAVGRLFTQGYKRAGLQGQIAENQAILDALGHAGDATLKGRAQLNVNWATEKMGQLDTPTEILGKWASGLVMLSAGAALRLSPIAGEHWYEVKPSPGSDKRIDFRSATTVAGFMFLAELAKEKAAGEITMSREDITQGIALAGLRSGVGLTLVDMVSGRGNMSLDGWVQTATDLVGMFGAGFFNPISQTKDLAALVDPNQAKFRDTRDTLPMRAYGPAVNQLPFVRDKLLPESPSPTQAGAKRIDAPLSHFLGVNIDTKTPIEQELARLGFDNAAVYPKEKDKVDQRLITQGQGEILGGQAGKLLNNPRYQVLPAPMQHKTLQTFLHEARKGALGKLDPVTIREILLNRRAQKEQQ